ncbi:MAG: SDR family oxidoreductase [Pseudonocardiaceae bacterium]|nr:SDR family oxidoreductase [Pseudonocardiaceae bacterium]
MRYLVTGGTGFLGRHVLARLVSRQDCDAVTVLIREASRDRLTRLAARLDGGERIRPVVGDLTAPDLGLRQADLDELTGVDHVVHLAAIYDLAAGEEANRKANVDGTGRVVELATRVGAGCLHHVSSVAVAGDHPGRFTEADFDTGQGLPSPYHATKFAAEALVRESATPWRVYRPAVVVGDSRTGEMVKVDGPYYLLPAIAWLASLRAPAPVPMPMPLPDLGATNIVPVDYVADALVELAHRPGLDGRAFHLVAPRPQGMVEVYDAFARAAGAPRASTVLPGAVSRPLLGLAGAAGGLLGRLPGADSLRSAALAELGVPEEVLPHLTFRPVFDSTATQAELAGSGIRVPDLSEYASVLWGYWARHLDPLRPRLPRPGGPLAGRRVVVTGASSGIGRATALQIAERHGVPLLVARRAEELEEVRAEIERGGGQAHVYSCDITEPESVDELIKQLLADHESIDMLVNNAGRSIRRSVRLSYDRMHDYERTMAVNYFGAVRLTLGLLPHMTTRQFGHIVNISSIGVQTNTPRFSAYVSSKAALDAFARVVASETYGNGVTFTIVHMPLVRTPMIEPTKIYRAFPAATPEEAAGMVVRALEQRPKEISTALGTAGAIAYTVAPRLTDSLLHVAYRVFPDSPSDRESETDESTALTRGARAMIRLLPGVHW